MSESINTPTVEEAQATYSERKARLADLESEIVDVKAELERLDSLGEISAKEALGESNAKRALRKLQGEQVAAAAAVEAARDALSAAERARDLGIVSKAREEATSRRTKLEAKIAALADDARTAEEAVFAMLETDSRLEGLRTEVLGLRECATRVASLDLSPAERRLDLGPWSSLRLAFSGHSFFLAVVKLVSATRGDRAKEERGREVERLADEKKALEPRLTVDDAGRVEYVFTSEQVELIQVPESLLDLARHDPARAIATLEPQMLALLAAKLPEFALSLRFARERNALRAGARDPRAPPAAEHTASRHEATEYDPFTEGA